jgi:hypothetical protein
VTQHLEARVARTNDDRRPQLRQRHRPRGQHPTDLVTAGKCGESALPRHRPNRRNTRSARRARQRASSRKYSAALRSRVCQSDCEPIECTK